MSTINYREWLIGELRKSNELCAAYLKESLIDEPDMLAEEYIAVLKLSVKHVIEALEANTERL